MSDNKVDLNKDFNLFTREDGFKSPKHHKDKSYRDFITAEIKECYDIRNTEKGQITVVLAPLVFFTHDEKYIFTTWINKLSCLIGSEHDGLELYLYIEARRVLNKKFIISRADLLNLMAIFKRYDFFNPTQLNIFKEEGHFYLSKKIFKNKEQFLSLPRDGLIKRS